MINMSTVNDNFRVFSAVKKIGPVIGEKRMQAVGVLLRGSPIGEELWGMREL